MKHIKKADLAEMISEKTEYTIMDVDVILKAFTEVVKECLARGDKVTILGFGTFYVHQLKERNSKHPDSGDQTQQEEMRLPKWKPGSSIKDACNRK